MNNCTKSLEELSSVCEELKRKRKKIVTTNGTFDLLHPGHIATLREAKSLGDVLIVAINSDDSVRKFKGAHRPIFTETDRAALLCGLRWVDYVTIFDEDTPLKILQSLKPDHHVKGGTFIQERIEKEKKVVEKYGGQLVMFDLVGDYSTTKIIEACKSTPF